jgi:hypothetical protein
LVLYGSFATFKSSFPLKYKIVSYCLLYFRGIIREEQIQLLRSNADTNSYFSGKGPRSMTERRNLVSSVADPDPNPDPKDPYVFGPPGSESGSISQRYGSGSGSGSFNHQAEIARKIFISTVL